MSLKKLAIPLIILVSYGLFFGKMWLPNTILNSGKDIMRYSYPVRYYLYEKLTEGKFPFWTERMLSGYPIYLDGESGYLNIPNVLLTYIFGPLGSFKVIHFLTYLLGSWFLYKHLKSKGISKKGWVVSHFIYFFNFFTLYHQQHQAITFSYYLFPGFILALERYKKTLNSRYLFYWSLLFTHLFYFGAFQMLFVIVLVSFFFLVINRLIYFSNIKQYTPAIVLTILLCLPFLSGYYKLYADSSRSNTAFSWREGSFSPVLITNLFYPFLYRHQDYYMGSLANREFNIQEVYIYMGMVAFSLGLLGFLFNRMSKTDNLFLLVLLALFVVFGLNKTNPIFNVIAPAGFSLFRYWGRLVFLLLFVFSFLAGHFFTILESGTSNKQAKLKLVLNKLNFSAFILFLLYLVITGFNKDTVNTLHIILRNDYKFDYWYLMLLPFIVSIFVFYKVIKRTLVSSKVLYVIFVAILFDSCVFGQLVLKNRFVDAGALYTKQSLNNSKFLKQRIVVTDGDVRGNKTLYYNFWSPFGYTQSTSKEYENSMLLSGFSSTRKLESKDKIEEKVKLPDFINNLNKLGIVAITDSAGLPIYENTNKALFYVKEQGYSSNITELFRDDGYFILNTEFTEDAKVESYVKYDAGWKVTVNKHPVDVYKEGLFISFYVPKGTNIVEISYVPHQFYINMGISALGLLLLFMFLKIKKVNLHGALLLTLLLIYLLLRLPYTRYDLLNSDGARWHRRSERFLTAIKDKDYASTYQHYQPGVTLMWINSATKKVIWEFQDAFKLPRWSLENSKDFPKIHAISKGFLVGVLATTFLYQLLIISKISQPKVALIYGLFVATEPYLIGIDRWFHLTSLESYFAFSAYLTFLYIFVKQNKKIYIVTGILVALATLSKLTAVVVLPLILFMEVVRGYYTKSFRRSILMGLMVVASFVVTIFTLFPALWVDFLNVMTVLSNAVFLAVDNDTRAQYFKPPFSYIYYLDVLTFKLSPVTLIVFVGSLVIFVGQLIRKEHPNARLILAYFLTFFLVLTVSTKKIDRYALSLIQPLILFGSVHLAKLKRKSVIAVLVFQITVAMFFYYQNFPALSGYYSPAFGGVKSAVQIGVYENSGEYFAQVASYLNTKDRTDVLVSDNQESFSYFYKGNTLREYSPSVKYAVTSVDFDRKVPRAIDQCGKLVTSYGPKFSVPVVYLYECAN